MSGVIGQEVIGRGVIGLLPDGLGCCWMLDNYNRWLSGLVDGWMDGLVGCAYGWVDKCSDRVTCVRWRFGKWIGIDGLWLGGCIDI